jgi:HAD superfamily hydrolase (TIGR01490 family)
MSKRVAFFDIDGTIFRSSLLIELVEALVERGIFSHEVHELYQKEKDAWQNRAGAYETYINAVIRAFLIHIKGVHYGAFADIGKEVVAKHERHVYRFTRDLLTTLARDGYYLVAISQSPKTILDSFCKQYGFHKVYGRMYETGPQDLFTGVVVDEHLIENKANIVRRVASQGNFSLEDAIGVGDTEGDIPLLELVGRPLCFNPNKSLYQEARRNGWRIVVERKDVIYEV